MRATCIHAKTATRWSATIFAQTTDVHPQLRRVLATNHLHHLTKTRRNREGVAALVANLMPDEQGFVAFPRKEIISIRETIGTDPSLASRSVASVLARYWDVLSSYGMGAELIVFCPTYGFRSFEGSREPLVVLGSNACMMVFLIWIWHVGGEAYCTLDALLESVKWRCFAPRDLAA